MGCAGMMGMDQTGKMGGGMGCAGMGGMDGMMEPPAAIADKPRSKAENRGLPPALRDSDDGWARGRDQDDARARGRDYPRSRSRSEHDRRMPAAPRPDIGRGEQGHGASGPAPGDEDDTHYAKTLAGMLSQGNAAERAAASSTARAAEEDSAAKKKAVANIAASFLQGVTKAAETSREAAKDYATAKASAPPPPAPEEREGWTSRPRQVVEQPGLYLPEPTVRELPPEPAHDLPPPAQQRQRGGSPRRSPSCKKRPSPRRRSPSPRRRRRGGGWDAEQQQAPPPQQAAGGGGGGGFSNTGVTAQPSRPALPGGGHQHIRPSGGPTNRFGVPEASPEALAAAVLRAQQVELAGLERILETGQIPRGPPDLPTGTEVIEQKCVAYLIGKGGQALAAINAAAGVSIQIDQSTKTFGWSMANIYGTEEGAAKAKMILRQKVSEYRPLRP